MVIRVDGFCFEDIEDIVPEVPIQRDRPRIYQQTTLIKFRTREPHIHQRILSHPKKAIGPAQDGVYNGDVS